MAIIADTSGIFAMYDKIAEDHDHVAEIVRQQSKPPIIPMAILAEVDYMLQSRFGVKASLKFLGSIELGAFQLEPTALEDVARCRELLTRYDDLNLGLADASVIATAERLNIQTILTLDERHFRVIRPNGFDHFILYLSRRFP